MEILEEKEEYKYPYINILIKVILNILITLLESLRTMFIAIFNKLLLNLSRCNVERNLTIVQLSVHLGG